MLILTPIVPNSFYKIIPLQFFKCTDAVRVDFYESKYFYCIGLEVNLKEINVSTRNWVIRYQDLDYWRALVNAAWNLLSFISYGISGFHKPWNLWVL